MKGNYGGERRNRLEGTTVGHWTVHEYLGANEGYRCVCQCGVTRNVPAQSLNQRRSRSCGCKTAELTLESKEKAIAKQAHKPVEKYE